MEWTLTLWDDFCERLSSELPLPAKEVPDYMKRISRTGCFQELVGYYDARPGCRETHANLPEVGGLRPCGCLSQRGFRPGRRDNRQLALF